MAQWRALAPRTPSALRRADRSGQLFGSCASSPPLRCRLFRADRHRGCHYLVVRFLTRPEVSSLHSPREVETVQRLIAEGWNNCQISRASGINRRTILDWRHGRVPGSTTGRTGPLGQRPGTCPRCDGTPLDEAAYAYLLGLYLGDGYIDRMPRTYRMRIFQDKRYVLLIELARQAISRVRGTPLSKVSIVPQTGCVAVVAYWNHWPCVFPQHGPGRKHLRRIELEPWQNDVVAAYPRQLLRGLIHSDGCRVMNRVQKRQYV